MAEVRQGIQVLAADHVNRAAVTAVAAVRPAHRDVFLAAKADDAVAAIAGLDENVGFVDKLHRKILTPVHKKASRSEAFRLMSIG